MTSLPEPEMKRSGERLIVGVHNSSDIYYIARPRGKDHQIWFAIQHPTTGKPTKVIGFKEARPGLYQCLVRLKTASEIKKACLQKYLELVDPHNHDTMRKHFDEEEEKSGKKPKVLTSKADDETHPFYRFKAGQHVEAYEWPRVATVIQQILGVKPSPVMLRDVHKVARQIKKSPYQITEWIKWRLEVDHKVKISKTAWETDSESDSDDSKGSPGPAKKKTKTFHPTQEELEQDATIFEDW